VTVRWWGDNVSRDVKSNAGDGLDEALEHLLDEANQRAPIEDRFRHH
jgi:hypothetical protein